MLASALAHARRSKLVLTQREAVLQQYAFARARPVLDPVVVVATTTGEVGRQIVASVRRDPAIFAMAEQELLLAFVQSRPEFFHRLAALLAEGKPAQPARRGPAAPTEERPNAGAADRIRVLVCAEGGVELSMWNGRLEPLGAAEA